jgi:hypothetical protein
MSALQRSALDYEATLCASQRPTARPPALERRNSGIRLVDDSGNMLIGTMVEAFDRHDFLGALGIAERLLGHRRVPVVIALRSQLQDYHLDHREGFLLSLIDGTAPVDQLFDIAGIPMLEVLRLLCQLVEKRVVALVDAA